MLPPELGGSVGALGTCGAGLGLPVALALRGAGELWSSSVVLVLGGVTCGELAVLGKCILALCALGKSQHR